MFWHWKAGIISNLSVQKYVPPFDSLATLLATDYKASLQRGSSYQNLFDDNKTENSLWYQVWKEKMAAETLVENKKEGLLQLLKDPKLTYFDNLVSMKTFPEYASCEIRDIPNDFIKLR